MNSNKATPMLSAINQRHFTRLHGFCSTSYLAVASAHQSAVCWQLNSDGSGGAQRATSGLAEAIKKFT